MDLANDMSFLAYTARNEYIHLETCFPLNEITRNLILPSSTIPVGSAIRTPHDLRVPVEMVKYRCQHVRLDVNFVAVAPKC
jgi:hypothetical protein